MKGNEALRDQKGYRTQYDFMDRESDSRFSKDKLYRKLSGSLQIHLHDIKVGGGATRMAHMHVTVRDRCIFHIICMLEKKIQEKEQSNHVEWKEAGLEASVKS